MHVDRRGVLVTCLATVLLAGGSTARGAADCTITGDYTLDCNGTTYRAVDDEGVCFVDLAAHNAAHPGVPLPDLKKTLADNYDAAASLQPVVVELTDYVDCTGTDHGFSDANIWSQSPHPNRPSRLMSLSGRTFRVTAAPDDGFATYYYSYDMAAGGTAGAPHLLVAESSNDQERYTSLTIHHPDGIVMNALPWAPPYSGEPTINPWGDPWWEQNPIRTEEGTVFGPDVGLAVYTGRELPTDNLPFNISMIFHPKTTMVRVVVSSLGCNVSRTANDGGAVSRMWVFRFVDPMATDYPALTPPADRGEERRIGLYVTHPWYFYAHHGTPVRLLSQRQEDLQRLVEHLKFCGLNYLAFNAINGADRSEKAWYDGSAYFDWNSAGDLLAELPPIAEANGIQLVPIITSLTVPTHSGGISFSNYSYQMGSDGDYTRAFGEPTLDPLRPEVQQLTWKLLDEIASRVASSPAVRGIGIRVNGKIGTCYTADQDGSRGARLSGYSSWDLQQFKSATGSGVPTSSPPLAYNWLVARPSEWEAWINWRCQKTRAFWLACRDLIRTYRSDLVFYVQCDLPSEVPGTNIEWANGETPVNLLRHHGYDPALFANDTGIVISRGMMVAADRFFVRTRWSDPYGTNYLNYRLFHYAPGVPELYRTAEGRACEMYQNYWEETFHPYFEFGSPGDPNGFFRTSTPAAPGRAFFAGATMSLRRQDPDTMVWLGWNRPTLGHEAELRKFAQAFRALPAVEPVAFNGTIDPAMNEIVARWHGDRLAVINDTPVARTITLHFRDDIPPGEELSDVVTGRKLVSADQSERRIALFSAEAYSLNTFQYTEEPPPPPPPPPPVPGVDNPSFEDNGGAYTGWQIVRVTGEGPDNPPLDNTNPWGVRTTFGTHFGGKITNGLQMNFYLGQVVGTSNWNSRSTEAAWQLTAYVQLNSTHENHPNPSGVHQTWEIGWNDDGSEPADIMQCDHYQVVADIDGNFTGNDSANFYPLAADGTITGVTGMRGVAVRVRIYNDSSWWWTLANIDNLGFVVTSVGPPLSVADLDKDGDVDLSDFSYFQSCFGGPNRPPAQSGCDSADLDGDADVDLADFAVFQSCFNGPNRPPACEGA
jgi:hypothetical protein